MFANLSHRHGSLRPGPECVGASSLSSSIQGGEVVEAMVKGYEVGKEVVEAGCPAAPHEQARFVTVQPGPGPGPLVRLGVPASSRTVPAQPNLARPGPARLGPTRFRSARSNAA